MVICERCGRALEYIPPGKSVKYGQCKNCFSWFHVGCIKRFTKYHRSKWILCPSCRYSQPYFSKIMTIGKLIKDKTGTLRFKGKPLPPEGECEMCSGSGTITSGSGTVACPRCKNPSQRECEFCGGSGTVTSGVDTITCSNCKGTGHPLEERFRVKRDDKSYKLRTKPIRWDYEHRGAWIGGLIAASISLGLYILLHVLIPTVEDWSFGNASQAGGVIFLGFFAFLILFIGIGCCSAELDMGDEPRRPDGNLKIEPIIVLMVLIVQLLLYIIFLAI